MLTVDIDNEEYSLELARYGNGRAAVIGRCDDGMQVLTVNLVDEPLDDNEIALNHDCSVSIYKALLDAGLIEYFGRTVPCGYTHTIVVRAKGGLLELLEEDQR